MKKNLRTEFTSRQYMISRDFEIYYYNDKGLTKVNDHRHDYYEFYFFLEGNVELVIENVPYELHYGDVVLLPPGVAHHADIRDHKTPYRRFVFWISQDYMNYFLQKSDCYQYILTAAENGRFIMCNDRIEANSIHSQIISLLEELHTTRFAREAKMELCVQELLLHLNRSLYERDTIHKKRESSLYESLLSYIEQNLEEELSLDQIANHFFMSKYHIAHIFKENMGISIHQYILKKRLAACKDALLSDHYVTSFYEDWGFKDYSSFYRSFKKEFGISPKEFRQSHTFLSQKS